MTEIARSNAMSQRSDVNCIVPTERACTLAPTSHIGPQPNQVVISISDRPVDFGETDLEATQIFEAYRREGAECVWESF